MYVWSFIWIEVNNFQEDSLLKGLGYILALVSLFDEYVNDFLYLREGSCLPRCCIWLRWFFILYNWYQKRGAGDLIPENRTNSETSPWQPGLGTVRTQILSRERTTAWRLEEKTRSMRNSSRKSQEHWSGKSSHTKQCRYRVLSVQAVINFVSHELQS
jgi:hypothetical protein